MPRPRFVELSRKRFVADPENRPPSQRPEKRVPASVDGLRKPSDRFTAVQRPLRFGIAVDEPGSG